MNLSSPYIKIGNGTSNFYANLTKSYLKNYDSVNVIAGGYKISNALEVYIMLSEEFIVGNLQTFCVKYRRMHSMCVFTVTVGMPIKTVEYNIEYDHDVSLLVEDESVSYITQEVVSKEFNSLFAIGESCVKLFFVASQLLQYNIFVHNMKVYRHKHTFCLKMQVYKHMEMLHNDVRF